MNWQSIIFLQPYFLSIIVSGLLGVYLWTRRQVNGARVLAGVMLTEVLWTLGYTLELLGDGLETKIFWDDMQWFFTALIPLLFLMFVFRYTGRNMFSPWRVYAILFCPVGIFLLLLATNQQHGLLRANPVLSPGNPFPVLSYDFTATTIGFTFYFYALMIAGLIVLTIHFYNASPLSRAQVIFIGLSAFIPMAGTFISLTGMIPNNLQRDLSPITFAISNILLIFALFRYKLFKISPLALDTMLEQLRDGMIILDPSGRIVEMNPAALKIMGVVAKDAIGKKSADVFSRFPDLLAHLESVKDKPESIDFGKIGADDYELWVTPIQASPGEPATKLLYLRNITEIRKMEMRVTESEQRFAAAFLSGPMPILVTDLSMESCVDVNQAFLQMTGYERDELVGHALKDVQVLSNLTTWQNAANIFKEQGCIRNFEQEIKKKDDSTGIILISGERIESGGQSYLLLTGNEMTEIKRATQAIQTSEENYRKLFFDSPVPLWEEDFSLVKQEIDALKAQGVRDIGQYLSEFPDQLARLVKLIRITNVNLETLKLFGARDLQELIENLHSTLKPDVLVTFRDEITALAEGRESFTGQGINYTLSGACIQIIVSWHVLAGYEKTFAKVIVSTIDITEQQNTEAKLRNSEQKHRAIFESVGDVIFETDYHGILTTISPSIQAYAGYTPDEIVGHHVRDFLESPSDYDLLNARVTSQGWIDDYDLRMKRKTGEEIIGSVTARVLQDSSGKLVATIGTIRDVTARKQAEDRLAEWNAQLENLIRERTLEIQDVNLHLTTLIHVSMALNKSLDLNEVLDQILIRTQELLPCRGRNIMLIDGQEAYIARRIGYKGMHDIERNLMMFRFPLSWPTFQKMLVTGKTCYIPDTASDPDWLPRPDGEWVSSYIGVPLRIGNEIVGFLNSSHDQPNFFEGKDIFILETLANYAAIAIQNARLLQTTQQSLQEVSALHRISQDLITTLDPYRLMQDVVDLLKNSFNYYHVQIYIVDAETGDCVVRAASGETGKHILEAGWRIAAGEGIVGVTHETLKPFFTNDIENNITFTPVPFLPETKAELAVPIQMGNKFFGLLDIHQNGENILTERDLRLVGSVAGELAIALERAKIYSDLQTAYQTEKDLRFHLIQNERLATMGKLLASISHELNNPLQAIQNVIFLLKNEPGLSEQGQQDLDVVFTEAERMSNLIDRLRDTYRPNHSDDFKAVQVNDIVEEIRLLFAAYLRKNKVVLEFVPDPNLPRILAVSDQVKQVILNIFTNGVEAMPNGGKLTVTTQSLPNHRQILLTISDTGTGIAPDLLPEIFDPFITHKQGGSGLGLSISRDIVLKHEGEITAENHPNGGATFKIWLPALSEDAQ
jgi:PAS domain S-box-containing protein